MPAAIPAARRQEIVRAVASGLARGTPLTIICESLQAQGSFAGQSLYNWLRDDPEAAFAIDYARDLGFDYIAHECIEIADDTSGDWMHDADGTARPNGAAVLRSKLRVDTRLKLLARWDPKRYGEARMLKVEGEVSSVTQHTLDPAQLDDVGRAALRHLIAHAKAQGLLESPGPEEATDAEYEPLGPQEDVPD
jgi:terminase small subunit-like protein